MLTEISFIDIELRRYPVQEEEMSGIVEELNEAVGIERRSDGTITTIATMQRAADHIEKLEAFVRDMAAGNIWPNPCKTAADLMRELGIEETKG